MAALIQEKLHRRYGGINKVIQAVLQSSCSVEVSFEWRVLQVIRQV